MPATERPPSLRQLAECYGVSRETLRIYQQRGAVLTNPLLVLRFLERHALKQNTAFWILKHGENRRRIQDEIDELIA